MSKLYAVRKGRVTGIFNTWAECQQQTNKFKGAEFKSFKSKDEALEYLEGINIEHNPFKDGTGVSDSVKKEVETSPSIITSPSASPITTEQTFFAVDGGTTGNNSDGSSLCEFQIYLHPNKEIIYQSEKMVGTNNIAEFLAIVKCLSILHKNKENNPSIDLMKYPIYTDSNVALSWLRRKKCNTDLGKYNTNSEIVKTQEYIKASERFLESIDINDYLVLKWNTKLWGENPADYGRK